MMQNKVPIVYYHSIAPAINRTWTRSGLTLKLKFFEEHLKYFKKNNYCSLLLDEYYNLNINENYHKKYFILTFDDGYIDNYIFVYPLLKKYGFKGTIFISPDFVDLKANNRKTLFDYWNNKATIQELENWGFLNWDEMNEMQKSGVMDIQSHTMSHTKYFTSDKIIGFHQPGADCLSVIGNLYPERKPYYITDPEFEILIPYGYPIFEQASSVIAKKNTINQLCINEIVRSFQKIDWNKPHYFLELFSKIKLIYTEYKKNNTIIDKIETEDEYKKRLYFELKESKDIIENKLKKKVSYLCWPHGDNNEIAHKSALEIGYKATTLGKMPLSFNDNTRFDRFGLGNSKNSLFLTKLKTKYKIGSYRKEQPYYTIQRVYNTFINKN